MTPDLQCALLCEDVRLEANGFNTLVGVINVIGTPVTPIRVLKLCSFVRWINGEGTFTQGFRILSPDENAELVNAQASFQLPNSETFATNVQVFPGMEFRTAGDYPVEISLDGELVTRFPLRIVHVPPHVQQHA